MLSRWLSLLGIVAGAVLLAGCNSYSFYQLVPAPNLYTQTGANPYKDLPEPLRTPYADVLYVTDRSPEDLTDQQKRCGCEVAYGYGRSRSVAWGNIRVELGENLTWDELVEASTTPSAKRKLMMSCSGTRQLGSFPDTPGARVVENGEVTIPEWSVAKRTSAEEALRSEIERRLAATKDHDVYLFIHGYHSEFEWPAYVIAQMWHFMGRPGVPIAYSWPANSPGALRGYQYDRESGEFTVLHLKRFLKVLGSVPNVRRVCIVAHSRGTDVLSTALRELMLELGGPEKTTQALKLDETVYAAADLDLEVIVQRFAAEGLLELGSRVVFYVHQGDSALGMSTWLFSSGTRMGRLQPKDLKAPGREFLNSYDHVEIIDAEVETPSNFTHSYFYAHPAVLSDLILLLRDGRPAGAANGRPLVRDPSGFWILGNEYPGARMTTGP
jgi:esterase/lipase superfamily enzyme